MSWKFVAIVGTCLLVFAEAFDYCVYALFGLGGPWWVDVVGGAVTHVFVVVLAIILIIAEFSGAAFPLYSWGS